MRLPIILATAWLAIKIGLLFANVQHEQYGIGLNLLFIILIIFVAIRNRAGSVEFVPLVKSAMRPAALYIVLASVAIFLYYQWVDPGYLGAALDKAMTDLSTTIEEKGGYDAFKKEVPGISEETAEAYIEGQRKRFSGFVSPFSPYGRASIALLLLTAFALFYSVFMVAVLLIAHRYLKRE